MKLSTPLTLPHASFLTFSSNWSQISQTLLTSARSGHSSCWEAQGLSTRGRSWPVSAVAVVSLSTPFPWILWDSQRALLNLNQEKWAWPPPSLRGIFVSPPPSPRESQIKPQTERLEKESWTVSPPLVSPSPASWKPDLCGL